MYAVQKGLSSVVEVLVTHKKDLRLRNREMKTALMMCAELNAEHSAKVLLDEAKIRDNEGNTALMIAASNGFTKVVEILNKFEFEFVTVLII